MVIVHRVRLVEFTRILSEHLQWSAENRPCLAVDGMRVTHGVDIASRLVHGLVDQETGLIYRFSALAGIEYRAVIHSHENHVAGFDETPVEADRVGPEGMVVLGVSYGNVAGHPFNEALAEPVTKGAGEVLFNMCTVGGVGWESGDAREDVVSVAQSGEGGDGAGADFGGGRLARRYQGWGAIGRRLCGAMDDISLQR